MLQILILMAYKAPDVQLKISKEICDEIPW